jgi:hypothetical protein
MQVRLKKSWGQWSKGHVFPDMPGGQARTLIARGLAEELPAPMIMPKAMPSPVDRMMRSGRDLKTKVRAAAQ